MLVSSRPSLQFANNQQSIKLLVRMMTTKKPSQTTFLGPPAIYQYFLSGHAVTTVSMWLQGGSKKKLKSDLKVYQPDYLYYCPLFDNQGNCAAINHSGSLLQTSKDAAMRSKLHTPLIPETGGKALRTHVITTTSHQSSSFGSCSYCRGGGGGAPIGRYTSMPGQRGCLFHTNLYERG